MAVAVADFAGGFRLGTRAVDCGSGGIQHK